MCKKNIFGILVIGLFLFTGCSREYELKCEKTTESSKEEINNIVENLNIIYNSNKDSIKSATMKFTINLNSASKESIDAIKEEVNDYCNQNKDEYDDCKIETKDDKIVIDGSGDAKVIGIVEIDEDTKYEDAQKFLENNGYVCE